MRRLVALALVVLSLPAIAAARDAETVTVRAAPSAVYVDGVKVGSEIAMLPKQAPVRSGGRCTSSGCTIIVTY